MLALGAGGWSGALPISGANEFAIKLPQPSPAGTNTFAHAEVSLERATWTVRLVPLPASLPPYRLENCSPFVVRVHQRDVEESAPLTLTPYESVPYAWRCPAAPHRLVLHIPALDYLRIFPLDKLKTWDVELPSPSASDAPLPVAAASHVSLVVEAYSDGPTRVLRLLDRTRHAPLSAARASAAAHEAASVELDVQVAGAGLSLVDDREELLYFSLGEASVRVAVGATTQRLDARLGRVQVDTQVQGARYPVALFMRTPSGTAAPPTLQLSVERSWEYRDVLYLPRFRLAVGAALAPDAPPGAAPPAPVPASEVEVRLDEVLLVRLARFVDFQLLPPPRTSRLRLSPFPRHTVSLASLPLALRRDALLPPPPAAAPLSRREVMVYMEALELGAVRVRLTFSSSPGTDESADANNPLRLLGALGFAGLAANVDAAPLFLDALHLAHPYCSGRELASRIGRHYAQQMLDGVYKVLGSFSALGSPTALVASVGAGVRAPPPTHTHTHTVPNAASSRCTTFSTSRCRRSRRRRRRRRWRWACSAARRRC